MSVLNKLQNLPQGKKIKIMWAVSIFTTLLLIAVWILSYKWQKNVPKDLRIFHTIDKSVKDIQNNYGK